MVAESLLADAKHHESRRQWEKAADCYRRYLIGHTYAANIDASIAYAHCLRHIGKMQAAANILDELAKSHPGSEPVLVERVALHETRMDWASAEQTLQKLVHAHPDRATYYFRLGRAQVGANDLEAARHSYQTGFAHHHTIPFDQVIRKIQGTLPTSSTDIKSSYWLTGGLDNFGTLVHETPTGKYFTKIVNPAKDRERLFYEGLLPEHHQLSAITPNYVGSQRIDDTLYMTMEMLDPPTTMPEFRQVVAIARAINNIDVSDVGPDYANPNYKFRLDLNTPAVVKGFAHIHEFRYHRQLFDTLHRLAPTAEDPQTAKRIVQQLEDRILGNHLYAFVSPPMHYTLLHGDFKPNNIMTDTHNFRVIDWQGFRTGPRFLDIVKYAIHAKLPYTTLQDQYLFDTTHDALSPIEHIFFLDAYILMILLTSMRKSLSSGLAQHIGPALADMDTAIAQLKTQQFGTTAKLAADRIQRLETKLTQHELAAQQQERKLQNTSNQLTESRHEKRSLATKNRMLTQRLKNIETSKSWRLTAPLRRVASAWKGLLRRR